MKTRREPGENLSGTCDVQEEVSEWESKVKSLKDELMQLEGQKKGWGSWMLNLFTLFHNLLSKLSYQVISFLIDKAFYMLTA
jgi:hypothetical protein